MNFQAGNRIFQMAQVYVYLSSEFLGVHPPQLGLKFQ